MKLTEIEELLHKFYPDILFMGTGSNKPLSIYITNDASPRHIRLSISSGEPLHLEYIEIMSDKESGEENISSKCTFSFSSIKVGTNHLVDSNDIIIKKNHGVGFHTSAGGHQWVTAHIPDGEICNRIVFFNRNDAYAFRAWTAKVESSLDGLSWKLIYSHESRINHFLETARNSINHSVQPTVVSLEYYIVVEFIGLILFRDFTKAYELYKSIKPISFHKNNLKDFANKNFLIPNGLELGIHGITKSFRFWQLKEKSIYLSLAKNLILDLLELTEYVSLGYGAVLGYLRSGDLIDHDDDIDIMLAFPLERFDSIPNSIDYTSNYLISLGYNVGGRYDTHIKVRRTGSSLPYIDVFFGVIEESFASWYPGPRKIIKKDSIFPTINATICDVDLPIPNNPSSYLNDIYGKKWMISDPFFSHRWNGLIDFSDVT